MLTFYELLTSWKGLLTKGKLSGLLFGSCIFGGLGLGMLYNNIKFLILNNQFHVGRVNTSVQMDTETAMILSQLSSTGSDGEPEPVSWRVSSDYFPVGLSHGEELPDQVIIIGDQVHDQYGRQWIIPCSDTWSGIYKVTHPVLRWFI